jgi:predicted DNA-binding transcriptional regulator YafY
LLLGARIVQSWADPELARAAAAAIDKVAAVSPDALRRQFDLVRLWAPADHARQVITIEDQAALRHAIRDQTLWRTFRIVIYRDYAVPPKVAEASTLRH